MTFLIIDGILDSCVYRHGQRGAVLNAPTLVPAPEASRPYTPLCCRRHYVILRYFDALCLTGLTWSRLHDDGNGMLVVWGLLAGLSVWSSFCAFYWANVRGAERGCGRGAVEVWGSGRVALGVTWPTAGHGAAQARWAMACDVRNYTPRVFLPSAPAFTQL